MNIFALDNNPALAAQAHCDKHVVKMCLETAQLLCTTVQVLAPQHAENLYRKTHAQHPCALWVRRSCYNFNWTMALFQALGHEFEYRYGKTHKSLGLYDRLFDAGQRIKWHRYDLTPFAQAMPDEYKVPDDPVAAYRMYYVGAKGHLLQYTRRPPPTFLTACKGSAPVLM